MNDVFFTMEGKSGMFLSIFVGSCVVCIGIYAGTYVGTYFGGLNVILYIVGIIAVIYGFIYNDLYNKKMADKERLEQIESDYYDALKCSDKAEALRLGRIYYGSLREDGNVTIYDEQAITNDLNSMTNTVNVINTVINKVQNEEPKFIDSSINQKTMYCSKCGKKYLPDVSKKFCEECGNKY